MDRSSQTSLAALAGAAVVALGSFLLALPQVLATWRVSPDTIEFIGIAHNWVQGRGWVDPVLYSTYLQGAVPPIQGMLVRPPLISFLMAPAIAMGASLAQLQLVQSALASLIAGGAVLLAKRSVSLLSAIAFGIALSWSPSWIFYGSQVLSEPLAVAAVLLLIAAAPGALRSPTRAALLGVLALLAWLTRPNLALILIAFCAVLTLERGRRAFFSRNMWLALAVFGTGLGAIHLAVMAETGYAPFAHYGLLLQSTDALESAAFARSWPGFPSYLLENADRIGALLKTNYADLFSIWFLQPAQLFIGWLVFPALVYAFLRRPARFESQLVALSGLGLLCVVLVFYGGREPERLAFPAAACFWLLIVEMLDGLAARLLGGEVGAGDERRSKPLRVLLTALPLILVLTAFGFSLGMSNWLPNSQVRLASYRDHGTVPPVGGWRKVPDALCSLMDKDAVVAAGYPWNLYLWCGNATVWLPPDLTSRAVLHRYLDETKPGYIVSNLGSQWPPSIRRGELEGLLRASPRLELLAAKAGRAVYRVRHPSPITPRWNAPPPIAKLGKQAIGEAPR